MHQADAGRAAARELHRVRWFLHAQLLETKLRALRYAVKANFDPNQPRVPAGHGRESGRWTDAGGSGGGGNELTRVAQNDPLDRLTDIPKERPAVARARTSVVKQVATHVARAAVQGVFRRARLVFDALQLAPWLEEYVPYIVAYADPPKTLEELQNAVSTPLKGYDVHHIVEQTTAEQDGFPRALIDSRENLVRIPTLKHWQVTAWSMLRNKNYGGVSPRTYLRGKSWEERMKVGKEALIENGVLKP